MTEILVTESSTEDSKINFSELLDPSWHFLLEIPEVQKTLNSLPAHVLQSDTTLPSLDLVFRCFELCKFNEVKVVLISQDPYPTKGVADGLAFSSRAQKIPASLLNIYKALENDKELVHKFSRPNHSNLETWAKKGVLLLNTGLTVQEGNPGSYISYWASFTDQVIKVIAEQRKNVVFMLWGNKARTKRSLIQCYPANNHLIAEYGHPSPLGRCDFPNCKNFSQCDKFLTAWKIQPINWNLDL